MPTRMFLRGRVVRDTARARPKVPEVPGDLSGEIPPRSQVTSIDRMLRAGVVLEDGHGTTYRVVRYLDPRDGWAPLGFFTARWSASPGAFWTLVRRGYLDAALEEGSVCKRFRVRDERAALAELARMGASRKRKT